MIIEIGLPMHLSDFSLYMFLPVHAVLYRIPPE